MQVLAAADFKTCILNAKYAEELFKRALRCIEAFNRPKAHEIYKFTFLWQAVGIVVEMNVTDFKEPAAA